MLYPKTDFGEVITTVIALSNRLVKSVKYDRKGTSRAANGERPQPPRLISF